MKTAIKYKIIILFILLDVILIFLFLLNQYNSVKRERVIETQNQISKIALSSNSEFHNTQKEIISKGYIDDIQGYIGSIRELSEIVKILHIISIKSIQEINNILYLTSMSVKDNDFKSENYPLVIKPYLENSRDLRDILNSNSMSVVYKDNTLLLPFKINKKRYVVLAIISNNNIWHNLYMMFDGISLVILLLLISFIILASIFLHVVIENQVLAIYSSLKNFFEYLKDDIKDSKKLRYIDKISTDELGSISKMINSNIKEIDLKFQENNKQLVKDIELFDELIKVLNLTKFGDFNSKIETVGDNDKLNELKDILNEMLINMDTILNILNSNIFKYINSDFRNFIKDEKYQAHISELINNLNTLGETFSNFLVIRAKNMIKLYDNTRSIDSFIQQNNHILRNSLDSLSKISIELDSRFKFGMEFKSSVDVFKKENRYINNQLDNLRLKYTHLDSRDMKIIDDTIKDIRYSLHLFDKNIDKFSSYSSSLENISQNSIKESIEILKDKLNSRLIASKDMEETIKKIIELIDDIKIEIIENSDFIGKDKIKTYILYKWEVMDV